MIINLLGVVGFILVIYTIIKIKKQDNEIKKEKEKLSMVYSIGLKEYNKVRCTHLNQTKTKLFYVEYSIQIYDGGIEYKGHIYAENEIDAQQIINQIACDLNADDHFIDVVEELHKEDEPQQEVEEIKK